MLRSLDRRDCQACRIVRTSGETELTCPVVDPLFCGEYSGVFIQDLSATSGVCGAKSCSGFGNCNNETLACECKQVTKEDFGADGDEYVIDSGSGEDVCGAGFSM